MIIKSCPTCSGHPYTTDISMTNCPACGSMLSIEAVEDGAVSGRPQIGAGTAPQPSGQPNPYGQPGGQPNPYGQPGGQPNPYGQPGGQPNPYNQPNGFGPMGFGQQPGIGNGMSQGNAKGKAKRGSGKELIGNVYNYSNTANEAGRYRRLVITKIIDALIFGQRTEDVMHRFYLRPEGGVGNADDIPVVVHGTLAAGSGIQDNSLVKVSGRYKHGTLYARKLSVLNNSFESPIKFQFSLMKLFATVFALLFILVGLIFCLIDHFTNSEFVTTAVAFIITFGIIFVIAFILSLIVMAHLQLLMVATVASGKSGFKGFAIIDMLIAVALSVLLFQSSTIVDFMTDITGGLTVFAPVVIVLTGLMIIGSALKNKN